MDRILSAPRSASPRTGLFAAMVHRLVHRARLAADMRRLDAMPREHLADMGLSPRTEANRRTSGEAGPAPRIQLW